MVRIRMSKARKSVRRRQKMIREQMKICGMEKKSGVDNEYELYLLGKMDVLKQMLDFLYWLEDEVA